MAGKNIRVFSSGILLVGPVDATLTAADHKVAVCKSATLTAGSKEKDLMAPPIESLYPIDSGVYGGECNLKVDVNELSVDVFDFVTGATLNGTKHVVTAKSKAQFVRVEFHAAENTTDLPVIVALYRARAVQWPGKFGMEDFFDATFDFKCYPSLTQFDTNGDGIVFDIDDQT